MTSYKQIFPLYTIDTTTKNQVVYSPYTGIENLNRDEFMKT